MKKKQNQKEDREKAAFVKSKWYVNKRNKLT